VTDLRRLTFFRPQVPGQQQQQRKWECLLSQRRTSVRRQAAFKYRGVNRQHRLHLLQ
jgi:hypothetical protein